MALGSSARASCHAERRRDTCSGLSIRPARLTSSKMCCLVVIEGINIRNVGNAFHPHLTRQVEDETLIAFGTPQEACLLIMGRLRVVQRPWQRCRVGERDERGCHGAAGANKQRGAAKSPGSEMLRSVAAKLRGALAAGGCADTDRQG